MIFSAKTGRKHYHCCVCFESIHLHFKTLHRIITRVKLFAEMNLRCSNLAYLAYGITINSFRTFKRLFGVSS